MTDESNDEMQEDLRKALQLAVCKIVFDEDHKQGTRTSQSAISALTELTYQYATKSLVPDLHSFSTHANRKSTISPDDVALVLRKIEPDELESFKSSFCRGGGKGGSKNTTSYYENNGKRGATIAGRRRKRGETDVLSLSSSSSSSDDDDLGKKGSMVNGKQKGNYNRSIASSRRTSTTTAGRKSTERESLLSKFQLRPGASIGNKRIMDYDLSSSSDDDDILVKSPPKGVAKAKTATVEGTKPALNIRRSPNKLSLKAVPFRQRQKSLSKSSRGKNDRLLDSDSDSSDDDDDGSFLGTNTKKRPIEKPNQAANASSDQENEYDFENIDGDEDEDQIDTGNKNFSSKENSANRRGTPKQSQVAEALANLSSDSGMDEDSEDEVAMHTGKVAFSRRHRPRIESDDDD